MQKESVRDIETPLDEWVTGYEWLGIVYPQDSNHSRSLITPLAYYDNYDNNEWDVLSETEGLQYFPKNGKVFHFHDSFGLLPLEVNQLYQFRPKINQKLLSQEIVNYSHYHVFDVSASQPLGQILDWTNSIPTVLDLPASLAQGIPTASCCSRIIYIRYGEYLYGPVHLEAEGNLLNAREYLSATHSGGKPLFLQKYPFNGQVILKLAGRSFIDSQCVVSPLGKIDCSLPQVTIKTALKAYKNIAERTDKERLVDRVINELASLHSSKNPEAPVIESCTLERAQYIVTSQMKKIGDLQNILSDLPNDHSLLLAARNHVLQHQKSEIEQELQQRRNAMDLELQQQSVAMDLELQKRKSEIGQELQQLTDSMKQDAVRKSVDAQSRLQLLLTKAAAAEQKCATAQVELKDILQKIDQAKADSKKRQNEFKSFELYMKEHLEELRQEPLRVLADLHISSALQRAFFASFAQDHLVPSIVEQATVQKTQVDTHPVVEQPPMVSESRVVVPQSNFFTESVFTIPPSFKFLLAAAKQSGVASGSAKCSAASLLAGLIPAIHGPAAACVLQAVAQTIAGNRLWSISIPLTALSPLDLLGTIASDARQFIPTGDLADIILEAQSHPQQLGIVLLEGVDRVPFLPVIAPFIQQYRAVRQQKQQAISSTISPLHLFHPRALANDDPYQPLARFCWPANLLLAVTLDQAPGNFVFPEAYEVWFTRPEITEAKENSLEKQAIYQIGADAWHVREKENFQRGRAFSDKEFPDLTSWQKIFVTAAIEMGMKTSLPAVIKELWPGAGDDESEQ